MPKPAKINIRYTLFDMLKTNRYYVIFIIGIIILFSAVLSLFLSLSVSVTLDWSTTFPAIFLFGDGLGA